MKKIILSLLIATSIVGYLYADSTKTTNKMNKTYPYTNAECQSCQRGHLQDSNQGVVFELSEKGIEPVFDAPFLKCDHCQILLQGKEFKNGYFSIPAPK
jgi:hypothetical protein